MTSAGHGHMSKFFSFDRKTAVTTAYKLGSESFYWRIVAMEAHIAVHNACP